MAREETVKLVHRVLALGKGSLLTRDFLLCNGTSNAIGNLVWIGKGRRRIPHSFIYTPRSAAIKIVLNNAADNSFLVGIYTCKDRKTGSMESIYLTNGKERSSYDIIGLNRLRSKSSLF